MTRSILGIIGGSGIYDLPGLANAREQRVDSPWGEPSGPLRIGESMGCRSCSWRAMTGATVCRPPTSTIAPISTCSSAPASPISSRCRLVAHSRKNCRRAPSCWSISSSIVPTGAKVRFSARAGRARLDGASGCAAVAQAARRGGAGRRHRGELGRHLCLHRGPAILHLCRELTYKELGYSVIGMTNMPEAKLAREAEICYATVAMVTDFDCWHRSRCRHRAGYH